MPRNSPFFGIPHPVTYVIDHKGIVRSVHFEEDFRERYTTGAILSEAAPGTTTVVARNERLQVTALASDSVVRGGERIRLFLTITPGRGMHVYAPGVQGYIGIDWKMEDPQAAPVTYPPSRMLHLKAIAETVPVYDRPFTLTREVVIPQPGDVEKKLDEAGRLRLRGSFRYQACDDRKCYIPEEIPLTWTLRFQRHDSTRVPPELRRK